MFTLRQAKVKDAPSFAAIHLTALSMAMPNMRRVHTVEEDLIYFTRVVISQKCWVGEIHNETAGFIALNDSWVNHLYVLPQFQGIGIGSKLLEVAKEKSPHSLQLWTFQENIRARTFYKKHGFVEVELTDGHANEERTPDVRLIWSS